MLYVLNVHVCSGSTSNRNLNDHVLVNVFYAILG